MSYVCAMYLWRVVVLELDSHPDQNKGPGHAPCACLKTHSIDHRSYPYYLADQQPFDCTTFMHGNEFSIFGAKAFPPTRTINATHLT